MIANLMILQRKALQNHQIGVFSPSSVSEEGAGG
jgi:hypothetical protein